jgi:hypothetical protein
MKRTSGPRRHTNHKKVWQKLQWGKATGSITVGNDKIMSYSADVDLCYCHDCKCFSYYDWNARQYVDLPKEFKYET